MKITRNEEGEGEKRDTKSITQSKFLFIHLYGPSHGLNSNFLEKVVFNYFHVLVCE